MVQFDNFEWLKSCSQVKQGANPDERTFLRNENGSISIGITEELIIKHFYSRYLKPFGEDFVKSQIWHLDRVAKNWALFCIDRAPIMIEGENDDFCESLERICDKIGISYTLVKNVYDSHKPFITNYDYYKFAYDNIATSNIHYFYILLLILMEDDYPCDRSQFFQKDYLSCTEKDTCKMVEKCRLGNICRLRENLLGKNYDFKKEFFDFQKELTESFIHFAPRQIKEKSLAALYDAFDQINKTNLFKDKLSLSFDRILYGEGVPLTGSFYLRWDKVSFYDGFYLIEHPSINIYSNKYKPLKINDSHSKKIFNDISGLFLKRLPPLYVEAVKGQIVKVYNRANLEECVSVMEYKVTVPNNVRKKLSECPKIKKKEISSSEASKLCKDFKSRFLDYLCKKQLDAYKVICCVENRVNSNLTIANEYSFIFTIKETKSLLYLAFENTADSRCTYVFPILRNSWKESIETLYAFFASSEVNKRQALSQRLIDLHLPGRYEYLRVLHTDYLKWVERIRFCL